MRINGRIKPTYDREVVLDNPEEIEAIHRFIGGTSKYQRTGMYRLTEAEDRTLNSMWTKLTEAFGRYEDR